MSFAIDVNILLYASDESSELHHEAATFIERCAHGEVVFCLAWVTVMSYLRMVTHPRIFNRPLSHDEAARNVEALTGLPHCRVIGEDEGFWNHYREITAGVPTRGNLVPDAQLAAILRSHGIKAIYTHDRDFRKFPSLDVRDPLEKSTGAK